MIYIIYIIYYILYINKTFFNTILLCFFLNADSFANMLYLIYTHSYR